MKYIYARCKITNSIKSAALGAAILNKDVEMIHYFINDCNFSVRKVEKSIIEEASKGASIEFIQTLGPYCKKEYCRAMKKGNEGNKEIIDYLNKRIEEEKELDKKRKEEEKEKKKIENG